MSKRLPKLERVLTPKKVFLIIFDLLSLPISFFAANYIFYDREIPIPVLQSMSTTMGLMVFIAFLLDYALGYWDQMWPYAGRRQYMRLVLGTFIETVLLWLYHVIRQREIPFGVLFLSFALVCILIIGFRLLYQAFVYFTEDREGGLLSNLKPQVERPKTRSLIVGAGDSGYQLVREMQRPQSNREPVAFIDDNPGKLNFRSLGVPVVGNHNQINEVAKRYAIDEIIIAIPSATEDDLREILVNAKQTGLPVKILPKMGDILDGKVQLTDLKNIDIEDLLGRDPIDLDMHGIGEVLRDKIILVTGGGGSIGSEIVRQIVPFKPKRIIVFDIYENNAYDLQQELLSRYQDQLDLRVLIGSVRDQERIAEVMNTEKPDIVFHAAAHKHVPLMETSHNEAVKNNLFGTYLTAMEAGKAGVERFVLISTDKAVNPTNVMGASKRFAEMAILAAQTSYPETNYAAVRFGNVLGSSGSVVPLFRRQIRELGYVTVTHPDIKRYFMTIPEAARLVLQAAAFAVGGEIFILDMGKPVKIVDLAKDLIRLSGYEPETEIGIKYIGLRPGEKLVEELSLMNEKMDKTTHKKIFVLEQVRNRDCLEKEIKGLREILRCDEEDLIEPLDALLQSFVDRIADPADDRPCEELKASASEEAEESKDASNVSGSDEADVGGADVIADVIDDTNSAEHANNAKVAVAQSTDDSATGAQGDA